MPRRKRRQPDRRPSGEMLKEVVSAVVPEPERESYLPYARELFVTMHRPPVPDFDRRTKQVVLKWHQRGLSGHSLWKIGERLLGRLYPAQGASEGSN